MLWYLLYTELIIQGALVFLLCLPLPSNTVRGWIVNGLSKFWQMSDYYQYTVKLLVVINVLAFLESIRSINNAEDRLEEGSETLCQDLVLRVSLFKNERNAYISGFNVFLTLVFYRLFVTMKQMHEWRSELKAKESAEKGDKKKD